MFHGTFNAMFVGRSRKPDVPLPPDSLPSRKRNAGSRGGCSNMLAGMQAGDSMGGCSYGLLHIGIADGMSIARDGACRYSK